MSIVCRLVRLSQENLFRLVIPVPESLCPLHQNGRPVEVSVPSFEPELHRKSGAVLASDVHDDTRTMHTEVDVSNTDQSLVEGLYAEATLRLNRKDDALAVPLQAVEPEGG